MIAGFALHQTLHQESIPVLYDYIFLNNIYYTYFTYRMIERQKDRKIERQKDRKIERQKDRKIERQKYRKLERYIQIDNVMKIDTRRYNEKKRKRIKYNYMYRD